MDNLANLASDRPENEIFHTNFARRVFLEWSQYFSRSYFAKSTRNFTCFSNIMLLPKKSSQDFDLEFTKSTIWGQIDLRIYSSASLWYVSNDSATPGVKIRRQRSNSWVFQVSSAGHMVAYGPIWSWSYMDPIYVLSQFGSLCEILDVIWYAFCSELRCAYFWIWQCFYTF